MTIKISELANVEVFSDATLMPVVDSVEGTLTTLKSNGAVLKTYITSELDIAVDGLVANAALQSELIEIAEANIVIANTAMKGYVDSTVNSANVVMTNYVNTTVEIANINMKGYVDSTTVSTVDAANIAMTNYVNSTVSTANIAMKGYVDAVNSNLVANAATQQGNIDLLRTDFTNYSPNAAVSSYLIENPLTLEQGGTGQDLVPIAGAVMHTTSSGISLTNQGTSGQFLISKGNAAPEFDTLNAAITFIIDGAGAIYSNGIKGYIQIPFDCQIFSVTMLADRVGSTVVDIWKSTYDNYPPTSANSICASARPTIVGAIKSSDFTLTGWDRIITDGDVLAFNVNSVTNITRLTITIDVDRI
jgi:hypothetical protein